MGHHGMPEHRRNEIARGDLHRPAVDGQQGHRLQAPAARPGLPAPHVNLRLVGLVRAAALRLKLGQFRQAGVNHQRPVNH
jgi:hypothetical protein